MRLLITAQNFVLWACLCTFPAGTDEASLKSDITETEFVISYDIERRQYSWLDSLFKGSSTQKPREMKLWVNLPKTLPGKQ